MHMLMSNLVVQDIEDGEHNLVRYGGIRLAEGENISNVSEGNLLTKFTLLSQKS